MSSFITIASERISACPRPQSSVQITGKVPSRFGVITSFVSRPGTASCFWPNCGTQKEWITSSALQLQLDGRVDRQPQGRGGRVAVVGVLEEPRELLRGDADDERRQRIAAPRLAQAVDGGFLGGPGSGGRGRVRQLLVLRQHDRADDRDRGHERGRDRRPDDLEARVAVRRRAVLVVVGAGAEVDDRVDDHRRDEREDRDADRGHEPEDEVDPVGLLARRVGQPRDQQRHRRGARAEQDSQDDQLDDRSPAHRGRDYSTRRRAVREANGPFRSLRNSCN